jgi:hypothetical protein
MRRTNAGSSTDVDRGCGFPTGEQLLLKLIHHRAGLYSRRPLWADLAGVHSPTGGRRRDAHRFRSVAFKRFVIGLSAVWIATVDFLRPKFQKSHTLGYLACPSWADLFAGVDSTSLLSSKRDRVASGFVVTRSVDILLWAA